MRVVTPLESRVLFSSSGSATLGGDWPSAFGGSPARTLYQPGQLSTDAIVADWNYASGQVSDAAIAGGKVFVSEPATSTQSDSYLVSLDAATGAQVWSFRLDAGLSAHGPTVYGGAVYFEAEGANDHAELFALDAATGAELWSASYVSDRTYVAPAVAEVGAWVETSDGMQGFDAVTGAPLASVPLDSRGSSPTISDGSIYDLSGSFIARYDPDGTLIWKTAALSLYTSPENHFVSVADGKAYVGGTVGATSITVADGSLAWRGGAFGPGAVLGIAGDDVLYNSEFASSNNNSFISDISVADGDLVRMYQGAYSVPVITDDAVISGDGVQTYVFDRPTATVRATLPVAGKLSVAENHLYVVSADGVLHAYAFRASVSAVPGGPYTVDENAPLRFSGDASRDADSDTFEWDFDYDASAGFTADATGRSPTFTYPDGPSTHTVALRVTTADGVSSIATTTVTVDNVAPTASVAYSGGTLTVSDVVEVPSDTVSFSYDFDSDGTDDATATSADPVAIPAAFIASHPASMTLTLRVADEDGGSTTYTLPYSTSDVPRLPAAAGDSAVEPTRAYALALDATLVPFAVDHWSISWGDGKTTKLPGSATSASHAFSGEGARSVVATAVGNDSSLAAAAVPVQVKGIADLTARLGAVPGLLVPGKTYRFAVTLTDVGTSPVVAPSAIRLEESADATPGDDDAGLLTVPVKLKLRPDASAKFTLTYKVPASLDGTVGYLVARADANDTLGTNTAGNDTSAPAPVAFSKYAVDLSPQAKPLGKGPFNPGRFVTLSASIFNTGTVITNGECDLDATLYSRTVDGDGKATETSYDEKDFSISKPLKAGARQSKPLKFYLDPSMPAGTYFFRLRSSYYGPSNDVNPGNNALDTPEFVIVR